LDNWSFSHEEDEFLENASVWRKGKRKRKIRSTLYRNQYW